MSRTPALALALAAIPLLLLVPIGLEGQGRPMTGPEHLVATERNTIAVTELRQSSVAAIAVMVEGRQIRPPGAAAGGPAMGTGSGFLVDDRGGIVTNLHVIAQALRPQTARLRDGASVTVSFPETEEDLEVEVVGVNPDIDMVYLRLRDPDAVPEGASAIPLAASDAVLVGQKGIAIGNPFGLGATVTVGVVSAVERNRPGAFGIDIPFIQTDTPINRGSSGGPLLDSGGNLMGINNAVLSPSGAFAGVGFAVPSNLLADNLEALRTGGVSGLLSQLDQPDRPATGITSGVDVSAYPSELRQEMGLPQDGVVVTGVRAGTPAAEAGIRAPGAVATFQGRAYAVDVTVITAVDGEPVSGVRDLQRYLVENTQPGDTVTFTVWDRGEMRDVEVRLIAVRELRQP